MAKLWISQFKKPDATAGYLPAVNLGAYIGQVNIDSFTTTTQSAALDGGTEIVRVLADANCCIAFGTNPTATAADIPLTANVPEYFEVPAGGTVKKIAAVTR